MLKAPGRRATRSATIALYRRNGEVAELQASRSTTAGRCPPPPPKCANGKDDDGDGMIDSRDCAGRDRSRSRAARARPTRPRTPSCRRPATCEIQVGIFDNDMRLPGLSRPGLRRDQGRLVPAARARRSTALFRLGDDDALDVRRRRRGTGGATFAPTNMQARCWPTPIAADATCSPRDGRADPRRTTPSCADRVHVLLSSEVERAPGVPPRGRRGSRRVRGPVSVTPARWR